MDSLTRLMERGRKGEAARLTESRTALGDETSQVGSPRPEPTPKQDQIQADRNGNSRLGDEPTYSKGGRVVLTKLEALEMELERREDEYYDTTGKYDDEDGEDDAIAELELGTVEQTVVEKGKTERTMRYSNEELMMATFPKRKWLLKGIIPTEGLVSLCGRPKRGKSTLARYIAVCLGSGSACLDRKPKRPIKIVYFCLEEPARSIQTKLRKLGYTEANVVWIFEIAPLNSEEGWQSFKDVLVEEEPNLVVIDSLTRAYGGAINWNDQGVVTALLGPLQELTLDYGCTILTLDHIGKRSSGYDRDPINDLIGSTAKAAISNVVLGLYKPRRGSVTHRALLGIGHDVAQFTLELECDLETEKYNPADPLKIQVQLPSRRKQAVEYMQQNDGRACAKDLGLAFSCRASVFSTVLSKMREEGEVTKKRKGHRVFYRLVG